MQLRVLIAANARVLGSLQADDYESHNHTFPASPYGLTAGGTSISAIGGANFATNNSGGSETRGVNTAVCPYLHV